VSRSQKNFIDLSAYGKFVDFNVAEFRLFSTEQRKRDAKTTLLESLIYRPMIFQRNGVRWIAAHNWKAGEKEQGVAALKAVKRSPDPTFLIKIAKPVATLIRQLFGEEPADAITCVPCGHSRRNDCFGKRFAQHVADTLELPFLQIFGDCPRPGSSHPRRSARLPPLVQIARPPASVIVVDDLATSGSHLEQALLALRNDGVKAWAVSWIAGATTRRNGTSLTEAEMAAAEIVSTGRAQGSAERYGPQLTCHVSR
jgi:hypothetical protein